MPQTVGSYQFQLPGESIDLGEEDLAPSTKRRREDEEQEEAMGSVGGNGV